MGLYQCHERLTEEGQKAHNTIVQPLKLHSELLTSQLQASRAQVVASDARMTRVHAQIAELQAIQTCRNCSRPWAGFLERHGPYGYLAKCHGCKAKHYSSHGAI